MMESDVPATGRVKQQAASNTAPQRALGVGKIRAATFHEPRRKRKIEARWQTSSRAGSGRSPSEAARQERGQRSRDAWAMRRKPRPIGRGWDCQLLDAGYVDGAIIGQRVVAMDQKHHGREQRDGKR
jgi:hypothetical protein